MKRGFSVVFTAFFLCLCLLTSCSFTGGVISAPEGAGEHAAPASSVGSVTVTFCPRNGEEDVTVSVTSGTTVHVPDRPDRSGALFDDWYTDTALTKPYDFSLPVVSDLTLYAGYLTDYAALTNTITAETMSAAFSIATSAVRGLMTVASKTGSGIVFRHSGNRYYLLTNNHVVFFDEDYNSLSYKVEDNCGNTYSASLVAASSAYDLAVLSFSASVSYPVIPFASTDAADGCEVVALGQPEKQKNALTYGKILNYTTLTLSTPTPRSEVTFPVIRHTAPIASGSSGGALLNVSLQLIGVNYADGVDENGDFVSGYAIPVSQVLSFLAANGITL